MFEDAPDDNANWGEVIDTEKKFYKTSTDSDSSSSSDETSTKKTKNELSTSPLRPVSRIHTAKTQRMNHEVKRELNDVKGQLERLEQRRMNDIDRLEMKITENNQKLEQLMSQVLEKLREKQ